MKGELTKVMRSALQSIAARDGYLCAWAVGTRTAEALRKRGLIKTADNSDRRFGGRWGYDPNLWITPAGLQALSQDPEDTP